MESHDKKRVVIKENVSNNSKRNSSRKLSLKSDERNL